MHQIRSGPRTTVAILSLITVIAGACNASASPSPSPASSSSASAAATQTPLPSPSTVNITPPPIAAGPGPNGGTVVRWFIGLGGGTQPAQIGPEQAFITAYNASQKDVYLQYEIVDNTQAASILNTEIAAGNAPDIIGPVGVEGLNLFTDQLLRRDPGCRR